MKLTSKIDNFQQVCSVFDCVRLKLGGGGVDISKELNRQILTYGYPPPRVKALTSALDSGEVSSTFGHANAIFWFFDPIRNQFLKK